MQTQEVLAQWAACDKFDTMFVIACTIFCWPIVPAIGMAYSGYSTRHNGLASLYPGLLAITVCTVQWWLFGYTLAFGVGGPFIGDFSYIAHIGVWAQPTTTIPAIIYSLFELVFEATVAAIAVGGFCERGRILPIIPFIFIWATFIYNPLAHMVWGGGFLGELGALDFAGGTPVHVCSGATASAISIYLSWPLFRSKKLATRRPAHVALHRPHNTWCQLIAIIIIWGSWLAFDGGTALALNVQAVNAMMVTNTSAAGGAITWILITYLETGRWSMDSFFLGAITGLIMITPASGYVDITTSFFFGLVGSLVCRQALRIKFTRFAQRWRWVDNGDVFATHAVGGILATFGTGLFAQAKIAALDGESVIPGGAIFDGNARQIGIQLAEAMIGFWYSFVVAYIIIAMIDCVPGFEVLAPEDDIAVGLDKAQMTEGLWGLSWEGEEDYNPFGKVEILTSVDSDGSTGTDLKGVPGTKEV